MKTSSEGNTSNFEEGITKKFNPSSPEYKYYINSFYEHSHELTDIFISNPDILLKWDHLMNEFNPNDLSTEKVSQTYRDRMKSLLDEVCLSASAPLQSSITKHQNEMDHFPDTMAFLMFSFYFF